MKMNRKIIAAGLMALVSAMSGFAAGSKDASGGANWPTGPVQMVVPAKAGGGTDIVGRIIAGELQKTQGKGFVIVNQASGGGSVAADMVRTAKEDGLTILFFHTSLLVNYHTGLYEQNPVTEFSLLSLMRVGGSYALAVGINSPYKTVADLVAAAKAKPGQVTLGVQLKSSTHFMAGLLMKDSGAQFKAVEAGSDADKLVTLQGGNIDAALINTPGCLQYAQAGKLRILATIAGTPNRDSAAPDIPSCAELGYKSTVFGLDFLVLGPKNISPEVVKKINAAFETVCKDPKVTEQLAKARFPIEFIPFDQSLAAFKEGDEKVGQTAKLLGIGK
ncbi:MAG: tripartite tricarboxylate transporter substrate binding protein [Treponemataceae bacterium]